jgi:uncharacterized protein involved in outer membrane biogenesis
MHDQLRAEMQSQIDQLKLQLSNSIAQLQEAQQHAAAANAAAAQGQLQAQLQAERLEGVKDFSRPAISLLTISMDSRSPTPSQT